MNSRRKKIENVFSVNVFMINVIIYDISLHLSNPVNKNRDSSLQSIFSSNIVVTLTYKTVFRK